MDECIDSLGDAKYFPTPDANKGFLKNAFDLHDYKKAVVTHDLLYEWRKVPFGLVNAPATFQRALDVILSNNKWKNCLTCIDYIVIFFRYS